MKTPANSLCAAVLLAAGILLLQAHALPFWQGLSGAVLGALWSLTLEAAALWLLFQRGLGMRLAGLLAALAILAAPFWQAGAPVFKQVRHAQATSAQMHLHKQALASARADKKNYQSIAGSRLGWHGKITTAKAREATAQKALAALRQQGVPSPWAAAAPLLLLVASLLFFQAVNLLAVEVLRRAHQGAANTANTPKMARQQTLPTPANSAANPANAPTQSTPQTRINKGLTHANGIANPANPLPTAAEPLPTPGPRFAMRQILGWLEGEAKKHGSAKAFCLAHRLDTAEVSRFVTEARGKQPQRARQRNASAKNWRHYTNKPRLRGKARALMLTSKAAQRIRQKLAALYQQAQAAGQSEGADAHLN